MRGANIESAGLLGYGNSLYKTRSVKMDLSYFYWKGEKLNYSDRSHLHYAWNNMQIFEFVF